mgnify:CR=1 FL=1
MAAKLVAFSTSGLVMKAISPSSSRALINAVVDALSEFGVTHIEMPATPERVWRAIQDAQNGT